ncbi:MAG TPA: O-antigen ligase family protein, partial [Ktedonobacterales bacterium]
SVSALPGRVASQARVWWARQPVVVALLAALGAYLLVIIASLLVASSRAATLKEMVKWAEVLAVVALVLWLATTLVRVRVLVWGLLLAGLAEAVLGYAQWAIGAGALGPGGASLRVFGTFAQPNPYAAFLNFALPLALAIALWSREPRERWVAGAVAVLLMGAEALAASRGAALGLLAALAVLVVAGWRWERQAARLLLVGGPLLVLAWLFGLIPGGVRERVLAQLRLGDVTLGGQVNDANFSTIERLAHWAAGLRMFAAHPLLGVGAGNYTAAYAHFAVAGWPEPLGHAHNYYITAAAETGLLGLLAFLAVAGCALLAGWCAVRARVVPDVSGAPWRRSVRRAADADLALGLFAVVVAVLVHSLTDDLFVHAMELCFALCLGLLMRLALGLAPVAHAPAPENADPVRE